MAETLTISRAKLSVPRPRIPAGTDSTKELTVDFAAKKSLPPSGELTISPTSYETILQKIGSENEMTSAENRLRKSKTQAELADAQEIVRRVGGRPSSKKPEKNRRKSKRDPQFSSEEDRATQKRRAQARGEAEKTSEKEEETELGQLEFARTLRNNPAQLAHLRRVLPTWDYRQLEARLVFWEKFEEREKNLASLAQQVAIAHACAQKKWNHAHELLAASLALGTSPKEYTLGNMTEILRQTLFAAQEIRARDIELTRKRRLHLATTFEQPFDPEPQNTPDKTDKQKSPMFGLAVRLNTDTDRIAKQLYTIARQ